MAKSEFTIGYSTDGDKNDFNLLAVPFELILPLVNSLRWEYQKQSAALAAPSFRQERALQHERHVKDAQSKGEAAKQHFIDFPVYD